MLKPIFYAILCSLASPASLYALGLGQMKVESALDQPFKAEIELIDVRSTSFSTVRIGIADPENFERIGIERIAALDLLRFVIEKNEDNKWVIKINSKDRISDPYIELVIDLAWPHGQLFKAYTVLLDPPGYQLASSKVQGGRTYYKHTERTHKEPGVIEKPVLSSAKQNPTTLNDSKNKATYGPTVANESVWQIAQRYKTSEVTLPQVVLAIVGTNPEDFTGGNLNGLKVDVRLTIPATKEIGKVPADLATEEVMVHDKAWNEKTSIDHVLTPPYMGVQMPHSDRQLLESAIPSIPKFKAQVVPNTNGSSLFVPVGQVQPTTPHVNENDAITKAQLSIATAAVDSMRDSNSLLLEQLHLLQNQNRKLQLQLDKRDHDLEQIRAKIHVLVKERLALAGQANSSSHSEQPRSSWPFILLLLLTAGVGGFAYWYSMRVEQEDDDQEPAPLIESKPIIESKPAAPEEPIIEKPIIEQATNEPIPDAIPNSIDLTEDEFPSTRELPPEDDSPDSHVLEFESGLHELLTKPEPKIEEVIEPSIELHEEKVDEPALVDPNNEKSNPLKSKLAFDTLLSLAKTYLGMGDIESARHSLNEVLEHGSESQQKEAQKLLKELGDK